MSFLRDNRKKAVGIALAYFVVAIFCGWFLKNQSNINEILNKLPLSLLLMTNAVLVFAGIPLSGVCDVLMLSRIGISYLIYWPFIVAAASLTQVYFFRSSLFRFISEPLTKRMQNSSRFQLPGKNGQTAFVFLIRAVPLMPFLLGSLAISMLPDVSKTRIAVISIIGCYVYYGYFGAGFMFGLHSS